MDGMNVTKPGSTVGVDFLTHYTVDDYVNKWSNSDTNWRRRSILNIVTSPL